MSYRPWTGRKIGIEMEMNERNSDGRYIDTNAIANALTSAGVPNVRDIGRYMHSDGRTWDVKTDSSCGFELASAAITLDENGHNEDLRKACAALQSLNVKTDRRCGVHVHVEVSTWDWRKLQKFVALWMRYEPFFFSILPESRRDNGYCTAARASRWARAREFDTRNASSLENLFSADSEQRFSQVASQMIGRGALNLGHFWRAKRIEFRLHSGTVDYNKLRHWAMLLLACVGRIDAEDAQTAPPLARKLNQPRPEIGFSPEYVLGVFGLGDTSWTEASDESRSILAYVKERQARFASASAQETPRARRTRNVNSNPTF